MPIRWIHQAVAGRVNMYEWLKSEMKEWSSEADKAGIYVRLQICFTRNLGGEICTLI